MPRPFYSREHDFAQTLLTKGKYRTRQQIIDYYRKVSKKLFPWLRNRRVMIIFSHNGRQIRRRKHNEINFKNKWIVIKKERGIDDPTSLEYYIYRKAIEFHPTILKTTDFIWFDIDAHTRSAYKLIRKAHLNTLANIFTKNFAIKSRPQIWKSTNGYHITAHLKAPINTTSARKKLAKLVSNTNLPSFYTTKVLKKHEKKNRVRIDLATLKPNGSIRAPYSL